jgi:hypothetical protein
MSLLVVSVLLQGCRAYWPRLRGNGQSNETELPRANLVFDCSIFSLVADKNVMFNRGCYKEFYKKHYTLCIFLGVEAPGALPYSLLLLLIHSVVMHQVNLTVLIRSTSFRKKYATGGHIFRDTLI